MPELSKSISIAGAWGYIGQKFLQAAQSLDWQWYAHDPGPIPPGTDESRCIAGASEFYALPAGMFHLAMHPEHRRAAMDALLARNQSEPLLVLCEKPMAEPEHPEHCAEACAAVEHSRAVVLYDFPELYDPMFWRIVQFLRSFKHVQIDAIYLSRCKDREDPGIPRNYKRMVPIQYQETVHCFAFALFLLAQFSESIEEVLAQGLEIQGRSDEYCPPNPQEYPYAVDGMCEYSGRIGQTTLEGRTDFRSGACWQKLRVIRGVADGQRFVITADFLEGKKQLWIEGESGPALTQTNSYEEVLRTCARWYRDVPAPTLKNGCYPNAPLARIAYQLSSVLWRACRHGRRTVLRSLDEVLGFDARFSEAIPTFPRCRSRGDCPAGRSCGSGTIGT